MVTERVDIRTIYIHVCSSTLRYLYQGRVHQVVVGDSEGLRLPKNAHRVVSSGTVSPPMN